MPTLRAAAGSVLLPYEAIGSEIGPGRASAVIIDADVRVCIVSCDVLNLTRDVCDRAAKTIEESCGVPFENVIIAATHTHHAPTAAVEAAIVEAARQAAKQLEGKPAQNDVEAELLGPTGSCDPKMSVIALRRATGQLTACLFTHGGCPDPCELAAQEAESRHGGIFLFLPGAPGSTRAMGDISTEEQIGRIGSALDEALGKLRPALIGPVKTSIKDDERKGRLQVIRLGEVAVVGHIPNAEGMEPGGHQVWMELHSLPENGADESPAEELSVREIAAGDALGLQRFYNTLDAHARILFRPMGWNALYTDCEKIMRNALAGKRYDLVAYRGGEILGWAFVGSLEKDYPGFGIAVSEEIRGQGLGARLMAGVVEFVRRHGNKGIFLTVVQSNDRARILYEKSGFEITGTRVGGDGLDYFDMRLDF